MNKDKLYMFISVAVFIVIVFMFVYTRILDNDQYLIMAGIMLPSYFIGYFLGKQQKK